MRKEGEPIRILNNGEDITATHDIIVHSRINNCGTKFNTNQNTLSLFDTKIECHCLSITNKRWIGFTGGASYIVELIRKPKPISMEHCSECAGTDLTPMPKFEHIKICYDCGYPNNFSELK